MSNNISITIITNIVTSYREGFYDRLLRRNDISVKIYCQDSIPGMNLKSLHKKYLENIKIVKYLSTNGGTLGFQFLPVFKILKDSDVIFLDGNPRILSNILIGITSLFFRKKKFVMWTMAHSYGANRLTEMIRLKWTSFFKNIFLYTDQEIDYLKSKGFRSNYMLGMNNGLDQDKINKEKQKWDHNLLKKWQEKNSLANKTVAVSLARITSKNKFDQVIIAMPEILKINPDFVWCLIGDGDELNDLKNLAHKKKVFDNIHFIGSLYDETEIAPYMLSAKFFIHPASIGLSLMHAFGYGLPVIVNNETRMHGPEYGVFRDCETGYNFQKDNIDELINKVNIFLNDNDKRSLMSQNCLDIANNHYNVNIMVERFIIMAKHAL